jgi:hypothetical protein
MHPDRGWGHATAVAWPAAKQPQMGARGEGTLLIAGRRPKRRIASAS